MIRKYVDNDGNIYVPKKDSKIIFRPAVYVIVQNKNKEFLLIENSIPNFWEFSGGGLKYGEDFIQCGIRELKEETGYDIEIQNEMPFYVESFYNFSRSKQIFEHTIHFFYLGKLKSEIQGKQNLDEGEKILQLKWFSIKELKKLEIVHWQKNVFKKLIFNL